MPSAPASGPAASPRPWSTSCSRADEARRAAVQRFEALRAEQKQLGKQMPRATGDEKAALLARTKELVGEVKAAESGGRPRPRPTLRPAQLRGLQRGRGRARRPAARTTTSCCARSAPSPRSTNPRDHLELGEGLGAIDIERGAKVSGSRFYFLTGVGALLQLGLLQLAIAQAVEHGFTPMITPVLVKPESMEGTGFLGAHASEVYRLEADDLYLVGTSEVPLAAYHSDEILDPRRAGPLRGLVVVLPPRGRLVRQGHPRHHPGAPVRQGRDVLVLPARAGRTTSTCGCSPGRRRCSPRSRSRTG